MEQTFLFLFLVLFPFGQVIRIGIIHPLDIVVGLGALTAILKNYKKPENFQFFKNFLIFAISSWVFSFFFFQSVSVAYGSLYLLRLFAYFYFYVYLSNIVPKHKDLVINSLLSVSVVSAVFGWIQFFTVPDIKPFFTLGWDQHLYRLVGTFLDPTFLGLIIVFGLIIALIKNRWAVSVFLLLSLAFTYSRASWLSLIIALPLIAFYKKRFKEFAVIGVTLCIVAFLLPTTQNKSISLFRTFTIEAKFKNYAETLNIFKKSPVFGVGYNNLCLARQKYISFNKADSHACSGSDSSLLFVLATTGIVGFMSFLALMLGAWKESEIIFKISGVALLVHSLFSNSMFYPWILGWMVILLAVG